MRDLNKEKWVPISENLDLKLSISNSEREQLFEILDLNAEQLTYYLEEAILDNPFIEMEYPLEAKVANISTDRLNRVDESVNRETHGSSQSLVMFLFEQIMMYRETPIRDAMVSLVDYLDERGYLPYTYKELAEKLGLDEMLVLDAMTLLKQLEPAGVGAYDLQECLMLQTEQDSKAANLAYVLLEEYFDLLTQHNIDEIQAKSGFPREEIVEALNYFHVLRPTPTALFDIKDQENIIPDVSIRNMEGVFELRYNRHLYPSIMFNQTYYNEMEAQQDEQLLTYIRQHKKNYEKLAKNLLQREALLKHLVQVIVNVQRAYFVGQTTEKIPYLMKDLAKDAQLSETIVGRVLTSKHIEFEHTVYPLSEFINVTHHQGRGGLNAFDIKKIMKDVIMENPEITNSQLVEKLAEQKIVISESILGSYRNSL